MSIKKIVTFYYRHVSKEIFTYIRTINKVRADSVHRGQGAENESEDNLIVIKN
jgi:hypothetical protein